MSQMANGKGKEMTIYTDRNGKEITVGTLVRTKGSDVIRRVSSISDNYAAPICATRIDGKLIASSRWLATSTLEVIEEVTA